MPRVHFETPSWPTRISTRTVARLPSWSALKSMPPQLSPLSVLLSVVCMPVLLAARLAAAFATPHPLDRFSPLKMRRRKHPSSGKSLALFVRSPSVAASAARRPLPVVEQIGKALSKWHATTVGGVRELTTAAACSIYCMDNCRTLNVDRGIGFAWS